MTSSASLSLSDAAFVEKLKSALWDLSAEVRETLPVLAARGAAWPEIGIDLIREELVAVVCDQWPALIPTRRRRAAQIVAQWMREHHVAKLRAQEEENTYADLAAKPSGSPTTSLRRDCLADSKGSSPRQKRLAQLREFCLSADEVSRFRDSLATAKTMDDALATVHKTFVWLTPHRAALFLRAVGYPLAHAWSKSVTFLTRLGRWGDLARCENVTLAYRDSVCQLAHCHEYPVGAVDFLIAAYSGAWRVEDMRPICSSTKPRCCACVFRGECHFASTDAGKKVAQRRPVRDWVTSERPRERLLHGKELSDGELLAIVLRTGSGELSAVELAKRILEVTNGSLYQLLRLSPYQLIERLRAIGVKGVGTAKAAEIKAALELGARALSSERDERTKLGEPLTRSRNVFERYRALYAGRAQEEFRMLILDTKHRVVRDAVVSRGTLDASIVHPRDVFRLAIEHTAGAVIFIHNHPSGDPTPSREDRTLTQRLVEAGQLLGIRVLDHVIIGAQSYYSFADQGEIGTK
ncbi:MAG: RadC family protein [Candidatus Sumerlaeaceae bacterium]